MLRSFSSEIIETAWCVHVCVCVGGGGGLRGQEVVEKGDASLCKET